MSNRSKLLERLQNVSTGLKSELDYYLNDVEHDEMEGEENRPYDLVDAFCDYVDLIVDQENGDKRYQKEIRQIYIDIGYAVQQNPNAVIFSSSGYKYWFKMNNIKYEPVTHWEGWINQ